MDTFGNIQPEYINIDETLRLRKYDGNHDFAFKWYQDSELVRMVDGENAKPYDYEKLNVMYNYLNKKGELYFIEIKRGYDYLAIGDVTFWREDMPIVIGNKNYRGKGVGLKVIKSLIKRAKTLGYERIYVNEIYSYNIASQRAFEKAGFKKYKEKDTGYSYELKLNTMNG